MPNKILRLPLVMARTGLSRSTIYSRVQSNQLAKPIKLGERAVGWLEEDVDAFIQSQIDATRQSDHGGE